MKFGTIKYGTAYEYGKSSVASDTATVSDSRSNSSGKVASETVSVFDSLEAIRTVVLAFLESFSVSDTLNTLGTFFGMFFEAVGVFDSKTSQTSSNRSDSLSVSDLANKGAFSEKTDSFQASDSLTKSPGKSASDSLSATDSISKSAGKLASDSLSISDLLARAVTFGRSFVESVAIRDHWLAYLNGIREGLWQKLSKNVGNWIKSAKSS